MRAALELSADEIDADPGDLRHEGPLRALRVRALTEAVAADVLTRTGRALGAGPLGHDEAHSRAVADLTVYLRQHHAERDLARLGELVAEDSGDRPSDRRVGCAPGVEPCPFGRARTRHIGRR